MQADITKDLPKTDIYYENLGKNEGKRMTEEQLLEYGIQQFENTQYDAALEAFVLLYMKGYEQENILENIYACYVEGNEAQFRAAYEKSSIYKDISYEECTLDFVPYKEGEYYIYDKLVKKFLGIVSVPEIEQEEEQKRKFDDIVVEFGWDWREYKAALKWTERNNVYAICHDRNRAVSFCKIPEMETYFSKIMAFADRENYQNYFHTNTGAYLPRIFLGNKEDQLELVRIWEKEHAYRLTPQGRNTDNIVLSIGIPTHDRGNLALQKVIDLLGMCYDAEIEIMVSKNGTTLYQEEYRKLGEISDARLSYVDHNKELTAEISWIKTVELSKGRFVLLVSDEDNVIIEALDHYLAVLSQNPELVFVRAKTALQYRFIETKECKKGLEAFSEVFLHNNYLSGAIMRRKVFEQLPFEKLRETSAENPYYISYTHEWWFTLMSFEGDCRLDGECLILEGDSVREKQGEQYKECGEDDLSNGYDTEGGLHVYATYESRLKQFKGYIEFIHYIEDKGGIELARMGVALAICKTLALIKLAYFGFDYKRNEIVGVLDQYSRLCIAAVDEFPFSMAQKEELLQMMLDQIRYEQWNV